MIFFKDKNLVNVSLAAIAVSMALIWLFLGQEISSYLFSNEHRETLYLFISGIMFSLACLSIFIFIKTILSYAEFFIQNEDLPLLLYRSVLDEDSEGIFFKDRTGKYRIMNSIARMVLDLNNRTVIGEKDSELHGSILAHKIEIEDRKVLLNGETVEWETEKDTGSGIDAYLCKKIPCRNRKGTIIGITGLCKNITILKSFRDLNNELEERYRNLFNKLPYPVLVLDAVSMLPFTFNNSMNELLGYDKSEFSKLRLSVHVAEETIDEFRTKISSLIEKRSGEFELRLRTKNKELVDISGYAQEVIIEERRFLHILLHDVTEIKKSTNELIGSELKYRSLFEHASDAIIIIDMRTFQINDVNEVAIDLLGYSREDITLMTLLDLDISTDHRLTQEKLNDLEIYNHVLYENEIRNRSGEKIDVEINAHKVNYGEDEVYQYVLRNITNRKKTEQALQQSEQRYRQMFESNQAIKLVINPDCQRIEDANPAAAEFYGYSTEELRGMDLSVINILSDEKLKQLIHQAKEQNIGFYSCPHKLKNGEIRFVEVRDGSMEIDNNTLLYSIIHDVTASRQAEDQLMLASKMFDCSTDAVMITDRNNFIVSVNQAFTEVTGFQQSEVISLSPAVIMAGRDDNLITDKLVEIIEQDGQWQGEIWHRLKNGVTRPLNASVNIVKNNNGKIINHVVSMSPRINQDDNDLADKYTGLTNLPNKSLFIDRLKNAIERSQRSDKQLAVLLIDFGEFSKVNDEHGYDTGDLILQAIAKRLKYNIRESDMAAHFSKDDFAVLLEDLADIQQTGIVAQKIISTLAESYQVDDQEVDLKVSIGISVSPNDGIEAALLLEMADTALKSAQSKEGNNFELTSSYLNESAHIWLQTEENLHKAIKNDEFVVHYLPQIKTDSVCEVEAVEALVRWKPEEKDLLLPLKFLPNAERSGFINVIGYKVIDMALSQYSKWMQSELSIERLWINIYESQIDIEFLDYLIEKCDHFKLPYNKIALDFKESQLNRSGTRQIDILRNLRDKGFYICVDDFGSGNASLACLLQCPVDAIKIDSALINNIVNSLEASDLLKGIMALTDKLNIDVIAEGVETQDQFNKLTELGCQHMQGYYFSRPVKADDIEEVIKSFI
jgi:diguanylate cyclase (GGDEF)-like protein/PAS domain S-box-containing protein